MKNSLKILLCALVFCIGGCIENDLPYPTVVGDIVAIEFGGQTSDPVIITASRSVEVTLADTVDLTNVRLIQFETSNDATVTPEPEAYIDLSEPKEYTLTTYQDYIWTISATQIIDRRITVENQVGDAVFDNFSKVALIYVASTADLSNLNVLEMKIGPEGATITPDYNTVKDFSNTQKFRWDYKGRSEEWSVRIVKTNVSVQTGSANAYAKYAIVSGSFQASLGEPNFMYKKKSDTEWETFTGKVEINGGTFTSVIEGLEPSTEYVCKAVAGTLQGNEVSFRTEDAVQLPNSSFDSWYKDGKSWFANADLTGANYFWDSGNRGTNLLGENNPTSPEESVVVKGKSVKLASTAVVGVFAAGSIYSGKFEEVIGLGARLSFGRPFTSRPKGFKGHFNYSPGTIDKVKAPYESLKGQADTCHIYAMLTDWDKPFTINTTEGIFIDAKNDKNIIAMCEIKRGTKTDGYEEFNLEFDYRDIARIPKYIVVVASASKYGDYFTGSTSSVLYVDEFELTY